MAAKRLQMRQLREILRLKMEMGLSHRAIAQSCSVGVGTVTEYLQRVQKAGLSWPLPDDLDDVTLEARLFRTSGRTSVARALPDFAWVHRELRRMGVTLQLLWHEYVESDPDGYRYSQFCERYRRWARKLRPSMRQVHRAGEKTTPCTRPCSARSSSVRIHTRRFVAWTSFPERGAISSATSDPLRADEPTETTVL